MRSMMTTTTTRIGIFVLGLALVIPGWLGSSSSDGVAGRLLIAVPMTFLGLVFIVQSFRSSSAA